jgi:hypothetical protein
MPEVSVTVSLAAVDRDAWRALFAGDAEDYDYLRAAEAAAPPGVWHRYLLVSDRGVLRAAAPAFVADYKLDAALPPGLRNALEPLRRRYPGLLRLRLACLGSPCTARALAGVTAGAGREERQMLMRILLLALERLASAENCRLVGLKDVAAPDDPLAAAARRAGFAALGALPPAALAIGGLDRGREDMFGRFRAPPAVSFFRHRDPLLNGVLRLLAPPFRPATRRAPEPAKA